MVVQSEKDEIKHTIESDIKSCIHPIDDQITMCKKTVTGKVILKCANADCLAKVKEKLSSKFGVDVKINKPQTVDPLIKIVGIHEYENNEKLIDCIR